MTFGRPTTAPAEASLVETLRQRSQTAPERMIFTYLEDGETETERLTYSQLHARACEIAAELQRSLQPGDRALLVYPPGLEFIAALFGCFYAGVIAVPVYPPRLGIAADPFRPLLAIVRDCAPSAILVGGIFTESIQSAAHSFSELTPARLVPTEQLTATAGYHPCEITRDTIALLQYTSGSTGDPKGVMISHGNILANEHVIQLAFHHRTASRMGGGVCWLPFYHDMGLIGNVLQAVYVDGPCWLMSPLALLQHPIRWLQAITKYQAHSSGGPNFAYDLCVRRITDEQKKTLDLSHWELAAIGAEPISPAVMDRFTEAFAPCGFRREAFYPCYGLAEATLFVTGGEKELPPVVRSFPHAETTNAETQGRQSLGFLVGCGHAWTDHEVVIVNPETLQKCAAGEVGEIWFRGPSVARGYWGRDADTVATFHVFTNAGEGPFLRTGDLGFLDDGELFFTGRLKDLIVIRGHNHYPQDIEETVAGLHVAFRPNSTAAIGCMMDGEEQLVVLQEIDRGSRRIDADDLQRAIRQAISEQHQLQVYEIVFLRNGALPKTTSGKIRRSAAREKYLAGQLSLWTGTATP